MEAEKKLVFAPWGAAMFGEDVLLFEHGLLLAMETAVEAAGGMAYADIHDQAGGADKRERPTPPLTEADVRALAARAGCDALVDGMLSPVRDPDDRRAGAHHRLAPPVFPAHEPLRGPRQLHVLRLRPRRQAGNAGAGLRPLHRPAISAVRGAV